MKKQSLQDKIFKYNVILILIPLLIVTFVGALSISLTIRNIEKETVNFNAPEVSEYFDSLSTKQPYLTEMDEILNDYGFSMHIEKNGKVIHTEGKLPYQSSIIATPETSIMIKMGYTIISKKLIYGNDEYLVIAYSYSDPSSVIKPYELIRIILFGVCIASSLILFIIIYLTKRLTNSIKDPINIIIDGSKKVQEGKLDIKLEYTDEENGEYEEFVQVCDTFNEMIEKLKENIEKTTKIEQDRKILIAGISHDLKTPLTSIKGYSKGIMDGVANTDEKRMKYIKTIYDKACVMEGLFNQLMLVSDLQTHAIHMEKKTLNVKESLDDILMDLINEYKTKIDFEYVNNCQKEKWIVDAFQLGRVFVNLIENTLKYCGEEYIKVKIECKAVDDFIEISFNDNGLGVSEDKIDKIFDLFYRVDENRSFTQNGSGLGLAIIKQIIELLNGKVEAKNNSGLQIIIKIPKED